MLVFRISSFETLRWSPGQITRPHGDLGEYGAEISRGSQLCGRGSYHFKSFTDGSLRTAIVYVNDTVLVPKTRPHIHISQSTRTKVDTDVQTARPRELTYRATTHELPITSHSIGASRCCQEENFSVVARYFTLLHHVCSARRLLSLVGEIGHRRGKGWRYAFAHGNGRHAPQWDRTDNELLHRPGPARCSRGGRCVAQLCQSWAI